MLRKFAEISFVVIPLVGVLTIISWHVYYGSKHPIDYVERSFQADKTYLEKLERAQKLVNLSLAELEELRVAAEIKLAKQLTAEELALFPTAAEVEKEMLDRYGQMDQEALASFIVGVSHLADHEPHHAVRLFRDSLDLSETSAVHLALGYTLKKLGEDLASYEVYAALKEEAVEAENDTLLQRAYRLADPSTGQHNMMMGVGIMLGGLVSLVMALVMMGIWIRSIRRTRMGIKPNEWPTMRRALYLKRMRGAEDRAALDVLAREVAELIDRRVDRFGTDDRPATLDEVREEAERANIDRPGAMIGEREYLSAVFLDAIGAHQESQRYYKSTLRRLDLPSVHLAQGVSLAYAKKKGAARKAYRRAIERARELGEATKILERAEAYLAGD